MLLLLLNSIPIPNLSNNKDKFSFSKAEQMSNPNPEAMISAAEKVASIEDLLTEILIRLPIKPLFRSKLVCKRWISLISSRDFRLRRNPPPNPARGVIFRTETSSAYRYQYIPLDPNQEKPSLKLDFAGSLGPSSIVIGSCNGLLLCSSNQIGNIINQSDCLFYVYNPTTQSYAVLTDVPKGSWRAAVLAFDPVRSPDYRVVMVVLERSGIRIMVYMSETTSWIDCGEAGLADGNVLFHEVRIGKGVYCNGSIHWLSSRLSEKNPTSSLRFNLDNLSLNEMVSPPVVHGQCRGHNYYFGESCGHLLFVEPMMQQFNVYEMKADYSEWIVKYHVDLCPAFVAEFPQMKMTGFMGTELTVVYVLSVIREEEHPKLVLRIPGKAIKISSDGTWETLCDFDEHDNIWARSVEYVSANEVVESVVESLTFLDEYGFDYIESVVTV